MSMELNLSIHDYKRLMGWFELAFAKTNDVPVEDEITFRKITVMSITKMEESDRHMDRSRFGGEM